MFALTNKKSVLIEKRIFSTKKMFDLTKKSSALVKEGMVLIEKRFFSIIGLAG